MSSSENPIIENNPVVLKSIDEFDNERSARLVKFFHSAIKSQLKDPTKQFILLVNSDISFKKYQAIWSNNPNQLNHLFAELTEKEDQKNPVSTVVEQRNKDNQDVPKLVPIFSATANDYYTDPETKIQHFPDSIFKYDMDHSWRSIIEGKNKILRIKLNKTERIKYIVIDFFDSLNKQYEFEIGFNSGVRDKNTSNFIDYYIPDPNNPDKRLLIKTEKKDELQFYKFNNPIVTDELVLNFISKEAGIKYLFLIENELSEEIFKDFLSLKAE